VLVDGVDSTAAYQQQFTKIEIVSDGNVWAEYTEDAILRFYYNDTTLNYNTCIGTMGKFSAHNTLRDICFSNYDHPMPYALGPLGGVGGQEWKILKLSNVQFWFNVPYNGKKYEFKLKAVKHMK
jgi:hypothetical protein